MANLTVNAQSFSDCAQRVSEMYKQESVTRKTWSDDFTKRAMSLLEEMNELRDFQLKWQVEGLTAERDGLKKTLDEAHKTIGRLSRYIAELQGKRAA